MNKEILKKILKTESICFSFEEIQNMLDEELEKSLDEMDTELVDLCVEVLSKSERKTETETKEIPAKVKKFKPKKVFLIAVVLVTVAVLSLPVGAKVFRIEAAEDIIAVFKDYIQFDFSKDKKYDLSDELHNYKLDDTAIPFEFFKQNCIITGSNKTDEQTYRFEFKFTDSDICGYINIQVYSEVTDDITGKYNVYSDVELFKQIDINGIDVIVYSSVPGYIDVTYFIDNIGYKIFFEGGTFDEVVKMIENF